MKSLRFASGLLAFVTAASAFAASVQVSDSNSRRKSREADRSWQVFPQPRPEYSQKVQVRVDRYLRDQTISLGRALRLQEACYGGQVESVVVHMRDSRRGSIALMMDYNQVDFRSYPYGTEVLYPSYSARIGIDFQDLGLRVMDLIYVESIEANLWGCRSNQPLPFPGNGGGYNNVEIERVVGQTFNGFGQLDLSREIDIYRYQGLQIQSIEIVGGAGESSPLPIAFVALMMNGNEQSRVQFLGKFTQTQSLKPGSPITIGRDMANLSLFFIGDVRIDRIRFKLVRPR